MKVRVGQWYVYNANGLDRFYPTCQINDGTVVKVINLHGAPPANMMGQCYVGTVPDGKFIGMVNTISLTPAPKK